MHVLDVAENSVAAGAKLVHITLEADAARDLLALTIEDDGKGMDPQVAAQVTDPFYTTRTTRRVGLGLPLLKMAAELTGGEMHLQSQPGKGTKVCARFGLSHIDRAPLGDMASTVGGLIQCSPQLDFVYTVRTPDGEFVADTRQLREILGDVPLSEPAVAQWVREYIDENTRPILQRSNLI